MVTGAYREHRRQRMWSLTALLCWQRKILHWQGMSRCCLMTFLLFQLLFWFMLPSSLQLTQITCSDSTGSISASYFNSSKISTSGKGISQESHTTGGLGASFPRKEEKHPVLSHFISKTSWLQENKDCPGAEKTHATSVPKPQLIWTMWAEYSVTSFPGVLSAWAMTGLGWKRKNCS